MTEAKRLTEAVITPLLPVSVWRVKAKNGSLDDIIEPGFYGVNDYQGKNSGFPPGSYHYGILEVASSGDFVLQRYTPHQLKEDGFAIYERMRYKTSWSSWKGIPGTVIPATT